MIGGGTANLSIIITAIDKASATFGRVGNKLSATGAKMKSVGKGMTMGLTLPIAAIGTASTKMGLDFSKGVEYANTMLKLSGKDLADFKSGVLDLSDKYGKSATDIAKAGYSVSSVLHTSGQDTIKILDSIAQGAKAGKITTEEAGNAVIRTMSIYGVKAKDSMKVVDTLSATVKAGNANWGDMAEILPQVAGLAKPLGVNLNETAAAFAAVSGKTGSSAEAGTALRGVLTGLIKPSDDMKKAVKGMGYENTQAALKAIGLKGVLGKLGEKYGDNAEAIGKLFPNIRGITGATALFANEGKDLVESMGMVEKSTGETQKQIEAGQGSAEKFSDAINKLKNAGIRLFTVMEPYLTKFMGWIGDLAIKFSNLSPATKKIIVLVALLAAALGPVLTVMGMIVSALPVITFLFGAITGPIGLAIAAIASIGAAAYLMYKHWDDVKWAIGLLWEGVKKIFSKALDFIKYLFLNWTVPGLIIKNWNKIKDFFSTVWEGIKGIFGRAIKWITDKIDGLLNIVEKVKKIPAAIKGKIGGGFSSAEEKVGGFFSNVGGWLGSKIPHWQTGGVVPGIGEQLAVVHGGETIIPRGGFMGGNINVYVQGGNYLDRDAGEKFAEYLGESLKKELRI